MNLTADYTTFLIIAAGVVLVVLGHAIWDRIVAYKQRKDYESRFGQDMPERGGENGA